jgi:cytochrome c-type biogenesis protein CcmH/NrfG
MSLQDARAALQQGRMEDAIAAFRAELAREPRVVETWQELAGALKRAGRTGEAENIYQNILLRIPGFLPARLASVLPAKACRMPPTRNWRACCITTWVRRCAA